MAFVLSGLGGAVNDVFSGVGGFFTAGGYEQAANFADKAGDIVHLSTGIKLQQAMRQGYKVVGATEAAIGANNLSLSGSAMDVLRSNRQQVSLDKNLVSFQGKLDELGYREKAAADRGAAQAAQAGGIGDIFSGALQMAMMFA